MARPLETYNASGSNATGSTGTYAEPSLYQQQTSAPGRGLMQLGAAIFETSQKRADQDEQMWIADQEAQTRLYWSKRYESIESSAKDGFSKQVAGEYNSYIKGIIKNAPSARAAQRLGLNLTQFGAGLATRAAKKEAAVRLQETSDKLDGIVGMSANELLVKGGYANLDQARQKVNELLTNMSDRIPNASSVMKKSDKILVRTALEGLIQNGQGGTAVKEIDSLKYANVLDAGDLISLRSKAKNAAESFSALNTAQAKKFEENVLTQMEQTGKLPQGYADIDAAANQLGQYYDGSDKQGMIMSEFKDNLQMVQTTYATLQEIKSMPQGQATAILEKLRPTDGDPDYAKKQKMFEYAQKSASKYLKDLDKDPVSALVNTPVVEKAAEELKKAQEQEVAIPGSATEQVNEKKNLYYESLLAAQTVAGVPSYKRSIVSASQAAAIAGNIKNAGADEVEAVLNNLKSSYGRYFPSIMGSIARLPGDAGLDPRYQMMIGHLNQPYTAELIRAIQTPPSEMDKQFPDKKVAKSIEDRVALASGTRDFMAALHAAGAPVQYINGQVAAVQAYAKYKAGYQGKKESAAVDEAVNTLFSSSFQYGKINGNTFAIPRTNSSGYKYSDQEIKTIEQNLEAKLAEVAMVADYRYIPGFDSIKDPTPQQEIAAKRFVGLISSQAYWATSDDFQGVNLTMDMDPAGNSSKTRLWFRDMSGRDTSNAYGIYYSFDELSKPMFSGREPSKAAKDFNKIRESNYKTRFERLFGLGD